MVSSLEHFVNFRVVRSRFEAFPLNGDPGHTVEFESASSSDHWLEGKKTAVNRLPCILAIVLLTGRLEKLARERMLSSGSKCDYKPREK